MAFFIGIDAGGTKTTAVLGDETRVLARAATGTIKLSRVGLEGARPALIALLQLLAGKASVELTEISQVCLGLAGARVPENAAWSTDTLTEYTGRTPIICEDADIALEAAFRGGAGALVISGTGSHVIARAENGNIVHTGGYGRLFSDEGSGEWIGMQAVRRAIYEHDFQKISPLLGEIMSEWHCKTFVDFTEAADKLPLPNFSALVPLVCRLAASGEPTALSVLVAAGQELAQLIKTALFRLGSPDLTIACTGSILENVSEVRDAMTAALPDNRILDGVVDPVDGALWMARRCRAKSFDIA
jgi:N-acetylglucosamine kinase-like BadF-type ATPase